jgi:hypothetical protein
LNIGLDYDNTYTRDPELWDNIITLCKQKGHKVYVVTLRYNHPSESWDVNDNLKDKVDGIFFTERKAKQSFMFKQGISIDVWVDDMPFFIENNAAS